jgi:hypothetical protein
MYAAPLSQAAGTDLCFLVPNEVCPVRVGEGQWVAVNRAAQVHLADAGLPLSSTQGLADKLQTMEKRLRGWPGDMWKSGTNCGHLGCTCQLDREKSSL